MPSQFSADEIREKYEKIAPSYDLREGITEILGVGGLRRKLLQRASGKVLEVAAGTGKNFPYYPRDFQITAVDLSSAMLEVARKRAEKRGLGVNVQVQDAEKLLFPDHSFDTVVSTLSLCTFPNPVAVLREMARVCRKDGRILLLEHGRSDREWLGRWQDRKEDRHAEALGCHWNREPLDIVKQAGLRLISVERHFFGIFQVMELRP